MRNLILLILTFLLLAHDSWSQPANAALEIQLNKNILQPGDSLQVTIQYKSGSEIIQRPALATVELIVENEQGQRTRLRWPMINGEAYGSLYLPDSLATGNYQLMAGLQQRFFEVTGQVRNAKNIGSLQAMLLTKKGEWIDQEIPVAPDGNFAIRNWLFEDNALLAFAPANNSKQSLDIRISTRLDSSNTPLAAAGRQFYLGNPSAAQQQNLDRPVEIPGAAFKDNTNLLPAVLVRSVTKTPAQQFNEEHASGLFRSGDERMLSIMDDPAAIGFGNILSYLQGRVAGLQISYANFNGGGATWRGGPVSFFIDELRVSAQVVASIPMSDIAIVKAFPPPFLGSFGGAGAIAIYTRRGGEGRYLPANRQVFKIRGYTEGGVDLDMDKLLL